MATDLNQWLAPQDAQAGWVLTAATGINELGTVVGRAFNLRTGANDGLALSGGGVSISPVPEPANWMVLITGLLVVGWCGRHRDQGLRIEANDGDRFQRDRS